MQGRQWNFEGGRTCIGGGVGGGGVNRQKILKDADSISCILLHFTMFLD